jgi:hypothetical protein
MDWGRALEKGGLSGRHRFFGGSSILGDEFLADATRSLWGKPLRQYWPAAASSAH